MCKFRGAGSLFLVCLGAILTALGITTASAQDLPVIHHPLVDLSIPAGGAAQLGVDVTGTLPLNYTWYFNSNRLEGATNATLWFTNAQVFQSGSYYVIVTNSAGAATSSVATVTISFAQDFLWVRQAGGAGDYEEANAVAADSAGNVYVAGEFTGTANFGTNLLVAPGGLGYPDMFLAKYTKAGDLVWVRQAGNIYADGASAIAVDQAGSVYVTGYFEGNVAFGSINLTNLAAGSIYSDIFVAKYDSAGNALWATNAGGSSDDYAGAIALDPAGNPVITGYFQGTGHFGFQTMAGYGSAEYCIAKLKRNGGFQWAGFGSSSGYDRGAAVAVDQAGRVYAGGHFRGPSINFFTGYPLLSNSFPGTDQPFLAKYTASGGMEWANNCTNVPFIWAMAPAGSNGFYAAGYSFALARLDAGGNTLWSNAAGGNADYASARGITQDQFGNLYLGGYFYGTNLAFPGVTLTNGVTTNIGVIASYDSGGSFHWARQLGGDSGYPKAIAADDAGNVYAAGTFRGSATFGTNVLTSAGGSDIFVVRLGVLPPVVLQWPNSRTVLVGTSNLFSVLAAGESPLQYQWLLDGGKISDATNNTLIIPSCQLTNAGSYSVLITNSFGLTAIPGANLNVLPALPVLGAAAVSGNQLQLTWNAVKGVTYRVQYRSQLGAGTWVDLLPDVTAAGSTAGTTYSLDSTGQRFYRVLAL